MGETFYTILGLDQDADSGEIRRTYRDAVKECHPDVSDDPEATHQFKRLTTARDVLLDSDDRATYDRLGHDAYVSQPIESSVWSPRDDTTTRDTESDTGEADWGQSVAGSHSETDGSAQWGETGQSTDGNRTGRKRRTDSSRRWTDHRREQRHRSSRTDGGYADEQWQRAPDSYLRTETSTTVPSTPLKTALRAVSRMGPWIFIHLILVVSALVTSWSLLGYVGPDPTGLIATGLFSLLLVAIVLLVSGLHLLTQLL
jgi:curved DNA-binding protein CbpA